MDFLDCSFRGYKQAPKERIIFEVAFFAISKNYKKDTHYVEGIKELHTFVSGFKCQLRVWCDRKRYDQLKAMQWVRESSNVELVLFECPGYLKNDVHEGLFGSVVRFVPMSIEGKHFITDIDLTLRYLFKLSRLFNIANKLKDVDYLYTASEYHTLFTVEEGFKLIKSKIDNRTFFLPYCMAGMEYISKTIPISLLNDYMNKSNASVRVNERYLGQQKMKHSHESRFPFGLDEVYINKHFLPYIYDEGFKIHIFLVRDVMHVIGQFIMFITQAEFIQPFIDAVSDFAECEKDAKEFAAINHYFHGGAPPLRTKEQILENAFIYELLIQDEKKKEQTRDFIKATVTLARKLIPIAFNTKDMCPDIRDDFKLYATQVLKDTAMYEEYVLIVKKGQNAKKVDTFTYSYSDYGMQVFKE